MPGSARLNPLTLADALKRQKASGNVGHPSGTPHAAPEQSGGTDLADGAMVRRGSAADQRTPVKYGESDKIVLPAFPQPGHFLTWKLNVQRQILVASGRDGDASARLRSFIDEVGSSQVPGDVLSHPGEFGSLEAKLMAAIVGIVPPALRRAIDLQ